MPPEQHVNSPSGLLSFNGEAPDQWTKSGRAEALRPSAFQGGPWRRLLARRCSTAWAPAALRRVTAHGLCPGEAGNPRGVAGGPHTHQFTVLAEAGRTSSLGTRDYAFGQWELQDKGTKDRLGASRAQRVRSLQPRSQRLIASRPVPAGEGARMRWARPEGTQAGGMLLPGERRSGRGRNAAMARAENGGSVVVVVCQALTETGQAATQGVVARLAPLAGSGPCPSGVTVGGCSTSQSEVVDRYTQRDKGSPSSTRPRDRRRR